MTNPDEGHPNRVIQQQSGKAAGQSNRDRKVHARTNTEHRSLKSCYRLSCYASRSPEVFIVAPTTTTERIMKIWTKTTKEGPNRRKEETGE